MRKVKNKLHETLKLGAQEYNNLPKYLKQESARPRPVDRTIQPQGESGEPHRQDFTPQKGRRYPVTYKVRLHCPYCLGEDFDGCFEGGSEEIEKEFDSDEKAYLAGVEETRNSPWVFDIIKVEE